MPHRWPLYFCPIGYVILCQNACHWLPQCHLVPPSSSVAAVSKTFTLLPRKSNRTNTEVGKQRQSHTLKFGKFCSIERLEYPISLWDHLHQCVCGMCVCLIVCVMCCACTHDERFWARWSKTIVHHIQRSIKSSSPPYIGHHCHAPHNCCRASAIVIGPP